MRNLDECKAEVFRRSEKRIENRRKTRKLILTCCIPLVLCVVLTAVLVLPREFTGSKDFGSDKFSGGSGSYTTVVEIRGSSLTTFGHYEKVTEPDKVAKIQNFLEENIFRVGMNDGSSETYKDEMHVGQPTPPAGKPLLSQCYRITLSMTAGGHTFETVEYTLEGELLTTESGACVELSEDQLAELKDLLGLT